MSNHLKEETSPYLLQHADNPVDWYPWCGEAFERAKAEDKPVFLSIGYSTCHWCHVMAHESFEDEKTADLLNRCFVSIKVDKEERPDIDSVYMAVCQAFTGSGGWPTSIFMTSDQRPFFAGTYFPKFSRYGMTGFCDLLTVIHEKWENDRDALLRSADEVTAVLSRESAAQKKKGNGDLISLAVRQYKQSFDRQYGGFGDAPKFPIPHNLLFLLSYYEKSGDGDCLHMAEKTLIQMYRGGLFDHIGGGFCRYSTDRFFLAPHFEKMLYDNAMLILAYCQAFWVTKKPFYREVAEKTAAYILREMTAPSGGFYSAQDADSEGEEGKYYVFEPSELISLLGESVGEAFNRTYDITEDGNFEGKSIPNLLKGGSGSAFAAVLPKVYAYRRQRHSLHLDDKILTAWNGLMIAAMCRLYRISRNVEYLNAARDAQYFIEENLCEGDTLFVSIRAKRRGEKGFLDDYADYAFALLSLYDATLDTAYLKKAERIAKKALADFYDEKQGGFYLYGKDSESLLFRPKESYDGAVPSGNAMMAYVLVRLSRLKDDKTLAELAEKQLHFLSGEAAQYPAGHALFLLALSDDTDPPRHIVAVTNRPDVLRTLPFNNPPDCTVRILHSPTETYPLKNGQATFYVCEGRRCLPPVNDPEDIR